MEYRRHEDGPLNAPNAEDNVCPGSAAPPLSKGSAHQLGCANAGIANMQTFIWTNLARLMLDAIGLKEFLVKKR